MLGHLDRNSNRLGIQTRKTRKVRAAAASACEALERRCLLNGVVRGFKYEDVNNNGVIDANDIPMGAVTIYADLNNNGVKDFNDPSTQTDAAGAYSLQLPGNQVTVREEFPPGYDVVLPVGGSATVGLSPTAPTTVNWLNRRRLDWGDAPDGTGAAIYPTLAIHNGARARVLPGYSLGAKIDPEADGQPNATATGDDLASADDEDGVTFLTPLVSGAAANIQVDFTSSGGLTGVLDAWVDFNGNGSWADPGERIFTTQGLVPGANLLAFLVPAAAVNGITFARFRLSPNGVQTFDGTGFIAPGATFPVEGEVEDYQIRIESGEQLDWGDAPDNPQLPGYPTLAVHNGARHELLLDFFLGGKIDAELDGQPNATATGDDLSGSGDEDGVVFSTLTVGAPASAMVTLTALAGVTGILDAWIDWNIDGDWADPGEQIATNVVLNPGPNPVNFNVPATAVPGPTYARFRLAQTAADVTSYVGFGGKGEVEDYNPRIVPAQTGQFDWGDAPAIPGTILQYPTLAAQNGARHTINTGFRLGNTIDPEPDGQPTINSDGDDTNSSDDEDGVIFLDPLIPGQNARVQVNFFSSAGGTGRLDAWIDWNADGNWTGALDQVANAFVLNPGPNILIVNVPAGAATGLTYSRFRLSTNGGLPFLGAGGTGEVEDHPATIRNKQNRKLDWGDAPNATFALGYPTLAISNGARHALKPGFYLGARADAEPDGQPSANADGDDINGGPDDEDGVTFLTPLTPGSPATIQIVAPLGGVLDAWIDWGADFSWAQPIDRIATTFPLVAGVNLLNIVVPAGAKLGQTYARFRLSPNGVASYDGYGFEGEVEDYRVKVEPHGDLDWGDAPKSYRTLAVHNGASHVLRAGFTLGNFIDSEFDGQPSLNANRDDLNGVPDDEDGVSVFGAPMTVGANATFQVVAPGGGVLDAWIDLNIDGDWLDPGEHFIVSAGLVPGVNFLNYLVPAGATVGDTYLRFRLTHNGIATFDGAGGEGEVEDYKLPVRKDTPTNGPFDWGDAPDSAAAPLYPTLAVNNGANHSFLPGFTLGNRWDQEPNGQPHLQALGDDLAGIDDEDGVTFLNPIVSGGVAQILVQAPGGGVLDAWIDWAGDGSWAQPIDRIATTFALVPGANLLAVPVPAGAPAAQFRTYSRFRLSAAGVASYTGNGGDGEVEDYQIIMNGTTVVHDPTTGILHVIGSDNPDKLMIGFDTKNDLLVIDDLGTSGAPDWLVPAVEPMGMELDLMAGDDEVHFAHEVDGRDFLIWQRGYSVDGGPGLDSFMFDGSSDTMGMKILVGSDPMHAGDRAFFIDETGVISESSMEMLMFYGGMGDDSLLLTDAGLPAGMRPSLMFNGGPGDDGLHAVDSFFDIFTEISFDGGTQPPGGMGDCLALISDGSATGRYLPAVQMQGAGIIVVDGMPINFTGLEPVDVASFASFELELPAGPSGDDAITIASSAEDFGDTSIVSGTSSGSGFEQAELTDVGMFMLDTAANDTGGVGASIDVVNFQDSVIGAGSFVMPAGLANLTLNVNAGSIPIGWDPGSLGAPVRVNVANGAAVHFGATQHLSQLNIASGGMAAMDPNGGRVLVTNLLNMISGSGQLDLTDNTMIVRSTPLATVEARLISGYNGGTWNGPGINSSTAASTPQRALGLAAATDLFSSFPAIFAGESIGNTATLIRYTLFADANLDRSVNVLDLVALAINWQQSGRRFAQGNFDYTGTVDAHDLGYLALTWQQSIALPAPPLPAQPTSTARRPATRTATRVITLVE